MEIIFKKNKKSRKRDRAKKPFKIATISNINKLLWSHSENLVVGRISYMTGYHKMYKFNSKRVARVLQELVIRSSFRSQRAISVEVPNNPY